MEEESGSEALLTSPAVSRQSVPPLAPGERNCFRTKEVVGRIRFVVVSTTCTHHHAE